MKITNQHIEEFLAKELEGGLFIHLTMTTIGEDISVRRDYYTVTGGVVYTYGDNDEQGGLSYPSGDTLLGLKSQCIRIGEYDLKANYQFQMKSFSHQEFLKLVGFNGGNIQCYECRSTDLMSTEYKCNKCGHNGFY